MSEVESIELRRTGSAASLALSFRSHSEAAAAVGSESVIELPNNFSGERSRAPTPAVLSRHNSFSYSTSPVSRSSPRQLRWLEYFNLQDYRRYMKTVRAFDDERQPVEVIRSMIRVCGRDYWIPGSKVGGIATIPVDSWALQVEEYETLSYRRTMSDSLPYCWRAIQNGSVPNSALKCGSYVETDEDVYVAKAVIEAEKQCGMYVPSLSQAIIPSRGRSKRVSRDEVQILCTL